MGVRAEVDLTNNLPQITDDILLDITAGLNLAAERGVVLSVDLSPWDQGTLAGAHHAEHATDPEEGAAVVVDTPYAARLHENPQFNFSTDSNPNAQGKWVENALLENRDELGEIIVKQVRR
jgi:hypothetical protein